MLNICIAIVSNDDDWEGVYVNGKLVIQDHTISFEDFLEAMGIDYDRYSAYIDDQLPESLYEVEFDE